MYKFCVFAGTTEGRELVEFLAGQEDVSVTACVATDYGEALLPPAENLTVSARRMTAEEMADLLTGEKFDLVVDATHPYAREVTENIAAACEKTGTLYLRLLRDAEEAAGDAVFVPDIPAAVTFLDRTDGNILLTTGSKEILLYSNMRGFADRAYARVLPMEDSLRACREAGLSPSHIIAMQGPFSREMNAAMLRSVSARYLVTKDTGRAGGFSEKAAAAREAGAVLVTVGRPPQRAGLDLGAIVAKLCRDYGLAWRPRVAVVGIGPGSREAMTGESLRALSEAECVIGAGRMLEAVCRPGQARYEAVAPEKIAAYIHDHREFCRYAVAMSGDTGFFSGTKKLLPLLPDCLVEVLPGLSSLSVLCARLGTSYEDVVCVSLHGRDRDIAADVAAHRRVFALVGGADGVSALCRRLAEAGLEDVTVSVGERLGYPDEAVTSGAAGALAEKSFHPLSAVLIENPSAKAPVVTHGLPDETFQRGGDGAVVPMTKSEVRAVALSKLRLTADALCWDVGAGTGSVAIEMALQAREGRVYAIEKRQDALELLEQNRRRLRAWNLELVPGAAPEACRDLPALPVAPKHRTWVSSYARTVVFGEKPVLIGDNNAPVSECSRLISTGPAWAYLLIAEGCDNRCSFCAIPLIRGGYRSRRMEDILEEARGLAESGVKELNLVAQDTTKYGQDLYGEYALDKLLTELCKIDGFHWIRVLYGYPDRVTDGLLEVMAREPKVVKYIDLPLQHASGKVLKEMNRKGDFDSLCALMQRIRDKVPGVPP